ncbi:MAG: hypothetical protein C5B54_07695 [Acidobacteria bacterium]|nr:MAG: hypothetical protein C5B54_07695 [Acidobacteriota bacterium]
MNKAGLKLLFGIMACLLLIGSGISYAQEQTQQQNAEEPQAKTAAPPQAQASPQPKSGELPPPLEAEMTVAEHWSKNPYPKTVAAGARVHIVERGDTLWDLAQRYYNNPFLWPQIWDANKYIPNAHWIYPGDPVIIPPLTPISEEKLAQETATEQPGTAAPSTNAGGNAKKMYPIALDVDLYCSGFITKHSDDWKLRIIGNEENTEKVAQSLFDIVYINQGEAEGISPGDEFTALHVVRSLEHPVTLRPLGDYVIQTGRIKVVATQEHTATAQVTYSCDATLNGDYLVPFQPKEVPMLSDLPPVDRFSQEGPNAKGYLVFAKDDLGTVGQFHEVQIDMGANEGVVPGTRLILYRSHEKTYEETTQEQELPRRVLGEMVVFNVQEDTATGRIIQMYDFAEVGDKVEIR